MLEEMGNCHMYLKELLFCALGYHLEGKELGGR